MVHAIALISSVPTVLSAPDLTLVNIENRIDILDLGLISVKNGKSIRKFR